MATPTKMEKALVELEERVNKDLNSATIKRAAQRAIDDLKELILLDRPRFMVQEQAPLNLVPPVPIHPVD